MSWDDFTALVTLLVTVVCIAVAVAAVASGAYIAWVYRQRNEEALFLARLVTRDLRCSAAALIIGVYIAAALLGYSLGRPWGALVIAAAVVVLMVGVIDDALLWRKERRKWRP